MKAEMQKKQRKAFIRDYLWLGATLATTVIILLIFPERTDTVISTSWDYLIEMIQVLPAVMVIMGLFSVWVSKEMVVRYLGKTSGIKGIFLALLTGMLPTGPLYVAFPIAATLLKSGASVSNIIIFLSAWACIKLPQELMEFQFLGFKFMALRLALTIFFVIIMGIFIERLAERQDNLEMN